MEVGKEKEKEIAGKLTIEDKMEKDSRFAGMVMHSGIPPRTHMTKRLFTFLPMKGAENAYAAALKFASDKREHQFLTLVGKTGRGKTHLAIGIGWHYLEVKDRLVKYGQVANLLDDLRSGYNIDSAEDAHDFDTKLKQLKNCSLLILDDLGTEQGTPWAREKLDEIVDYRYINELPLVVTTNLKPEALAERLARRLSEGVCVAMKCGNYSSIIAEQRKEKKDD